jgi:NAD(P)-dependent dehydrogenase (short-subunit alcohol dehydrogenase family)
MSKVVLVTGGSAGIGAAVVRLAAQQGWRVAFTYRSSAVLAEALEAEVAAAGGLAKGFKADAAEEEDTLALYEWIDAEFGRLDALVANAGITGPTSSLENITTQIIDEVMAINIRGVFLSVREAIKRMATDRGGQGGSIVTLSSIAARLGGPFDWVHYAASKGATDSFTVGAAKELAGRGIRVNGVRPGLIDTEIHAKAGLGDRLAKLGPSVPMGRVGTAEEVADVILWLMSDQASYVTAALIDISGGR